MIALIVAAALLAIAAVIFAVVRRRRRRSIHIASGAALDMIGEERGLRRREQRGIRGLVMKRETDVAYRARIVDSLRPRDVDEGRI